VRIAVAPDEKNCLAEEPKRSFKRPSVRGREAGSGRPLPTRYPRDTDTRPMPPLCDPKRSCRGRMIPTGVPRNMSLDVRWSAEGDCQGLASGHPGSDKDIPGPDGHCESRGALVMAKDTRSPQRNGPPRSIETRIRDSIVKRLSWLQNTATSRLCKRAGPMFVAGDRASEWAPESYSRSRRQLHQAEDRAGDHAWGRRFGMGPESPRCSDRGHRTDADDSGGDGALARHRSC